MALEENLALRPVAARFSGCNSVGNVRSVPALGSLLGHLVSLLCLESIPEFLCDSVPQALRSQDLHVRHPRQDPPHQFLATRRLHPHFDTAVGSCPELLAGVPLPLGDVDCQFRLEEEPDLDRILATHDAERLPGVCLGAELGRAREGLPRGLDSPEPRQGERRHTFLLHVSRDGHPHLR